MNKYTADYRRQRAQQFYLFQKTARSEVSDENCKINDASPEEIKIRASWYLHYMGDSIMTRIDEKRLSKN